MHGIAPRWEFELRCNSKKQLVLRCHINLPNVLLSSQQAIGILLLMQAMPALSLSCAFKPQGQSSQTLKSCLHTCLHGMPARSSTVHGNV